MDLDQLNEVLYGKMIYVYFEMSFPPNGMWLSLVSRDNINILAYILHCRLFVNCRCRQDCYSTGFKSCCILQNFRITRWMLVIFFCRFYKNVFLNQRKEVYASFAFLLFLCQCLAIKLQSFSAELSHFCFNGKQCDSNLRRMKPTG